MERFGERNPLLTVRVLFMRDMLSHVQYAFETYEAEFNKQYETTELREKRRAAFTANLQKIKTHNTYV